MIAIHLLIDLDPEPPIAPRGDRHPACGEFHTAVELAALRVVHGEQAALRQPDAALRIDGDVGRCLKPHAVFKLKAVFDAITTATRGAVHEAREDGPVGSAAARRVGTLRSPARGKPGIERHVGEFVAARVVGGEWLQTAGREPRPLRASRREQRPVSQWHDRVDRPLGQPVGRLPGMTGPCCDRPRTVAGDFHRRA